MKLKSILVLFLGINTLLFCQATQSATANIDIIVPLSITAMEGDLDFGEIILTGSQMTKTIDPLNGKRFLVTGNLDRNVTIMYDQVQLTNSPSTGSTGVLEFTPKVTFQNGKEIFSGSGTTLLQNGNIGEREIWVGGSISIPADQPHGDYSGVFTLTVSY